METFRDLLALLHHRMKGVSLWWKLIGGLKEHLGVLTWRWSNSY